MGGVFSNPSYPSSPTSAQNVNEITITGLGTQWPSTVITADDIEKYALSLYPADAPWLQRLLRINAQTGIETRSVVNIWADPRWHQKEPPKAEEVDAAWRQYGVQLSKEAAKKALLDSRIEAKSITHVVSVTATNAGSPGYDQSVARELGVPADAERVLISGVGCAGGLAALRMASNLALAATYQDKPARILVLACEICSIYICSEFHQAATSQTGGIGPTLFGDGAAALVVCNSKGLLNGEKDLPKRFSVIDWRSFITPDTHAEMEYKINSSGFQLLLSKNVPKLAAMSLSQPFKSLTRSNSMPSAVPTEFDWALHPGGLSIIKGAEAAMGISKELLAATYEIYRTRGNASSVAVLAVLDQMRNMEMRRRDVIAASFGPGLTTEMALLKRWE
ncbi:uncharacterized protein N7484_007792 [Penicillium longicatenatum]|uniref:uncharacterized protein n=1 Tax=Penicillium longicatenatum TaxID=1561947 RepID=UPI002548B6ED|nr:uncharacterized protein N7484_007792 [Penicillium longicatenatum]KAJ5639930.1 hypothetical protein N7484_007792 [Penicillium longicatenatum]